MTALTEGRNTPQRSGDRRSFDVAASVILQQGGIAAMNANGFVEPMSVSTTLQGVGRIEAHVDNSNGGDGDEIVNVGCGVYRFANSETDPIAKSDIGETCYGEDDQTVALTDDSNTLSPVGTIHDVDEDGVWVTFT